MAVMVVIAVVFVAMMMPVMTFVMMCVMMFAPVAMAVFGAVPFVMAMMLVGVPVMGMLVRMMMAMFVLPAHVRSSRGWISLEPSPQQGGLFLGKRC
jgi:hypothetical protein